MRKFWGCKTPIDKCLGQEASALQNKNCLGHSLSPPPSTCWCQKYHKRHYRRHQRHQSTHCIPSDDSRTIWEAPWSWTTRTTAYCCVVTDRLQTHLILWRLQRGLLVPMNNTKGILENLSRGMAEWEMSWERSLKTYQAIEMNYSCSTSFSPICWLICLQDT